MNQSSRHSLDTTQANNYRQPYIYTVSAIYLQPDIRADTNRDGVVDVSASSDSYNKSCWTQQRGAIFLPNIGDKTRRCPTRDAKGKRLSDEEYGSCNDASGNHLLAPEYAAPLRTLPIETSAQATARIYTSPKAATERVRIFVLQQGSKPNSTSSWRLVDPEFTFNSTQLGSGIVLALDGRELVTDAAVWDGLVTVHFEVTDGSDRASDSVALKMAPVLTHHHLQKVDTLISVAALHDTHEFVEQLDEARAAAGIETPLLLLNGTDDIWAQDYIEPGYASMPGPHGPISLRVVLRSAQSTRSAGRKALEQLRGPAVGGFQPAFGTGSGFGERHINSLGNLETIPPYTCRKGVRYEAGRIIVGKHFDDMPARSMLGFLQAQRLQDPLVLEAGWLVVGHVDEFVQFVPYDNDLGFTIAIADTASAMSLMQKLETDGHGAVTAVSYPAHDLLAEDAMSASVGVTVSDLWRNKTFLDANAYAQSHLDANLEKLLAEIPLSPQDVIRVPSLFYAIDFDYESLGDGTPLLKDAPPRGEKQVAALYPEAVNGIVVGKHYLSPRLYGPVVDGEDVLAKAVEAAYARAGMELHYVDDFKSHHLYTGDVHCGTNTMRQTDLVWWW
ncbi:hypothetical protein L249_4532 [Ophiocordyceps polyrhachis-furcata BCC 54312]|uniref:Protein-arginine deiminase C-terminal domain-containing protein n=1 Tax=Ophiocordyceps polyrhachis-furcata BCC 54312 TaxID=1330021 RepID=A0A367KZ84_9HYPO|nr:hypothetical protein L249_4532 [Ophiocordyceps polyrhachis-furcata BCC 54312]